MLILGADCFHLHCSEISEEESDFEFEYEVLSAGSAEPWDDRDGGWVSADGSAATIHAESSSVTQNIKGKGCDESTDIQSVGGEQQPSTSMSHSVEEIGKEVLHNACEPDNASELDKGTPYDFEDLEQLMSEIGNMRDSLRLMPDFQRREMAAKLALKMAAMFGDSSGDEEGFDR